jgi:heat shock protein HslJ
MNPRRFFVGRAIGLLVVLIVGAGVWYVTSHSPSTPSAATGYKNATYVIDGKSVTLTNGTSEVPAAPGSASMVTTKYFGNELVTDLNGDGRDDVVFLLTQSTGGSGTFSYVVAALNTGHGYVGSDGYLLGDRIAPQTTNVSQNPDQKGVIVVNYAVRAPGEPMTAQPSVGKSAYLKLDTKTMRWGVVEPNFSGEADPSHMTLSMQTWTWVSVLYNNGTKIMPKHADAFTLTLNTDGTFQATTDCNSMSGSYTTNGFAITFSQIAMTEKFCQGSQEQDFAKVLENASGYLFTGKGELVLDLQYDSGSATFR